MLVAAVESMQTSVKYRSQGVCFFETERAIAREMMSEWCTGCTLSNLRMCFDLSNVLIEIFSRAIFSFVTTVLKSSSAQRLGTSFVVVHPGTSRESIRKQGVKAMTKTPPECKQRVIWHMRRFAAKESYE